MPTAPTPITPYSTPPSSTDPANFDARADAKVAQDATFVTEANTLATNVYNNAVEAAARATDSAASAVNSSSNASAAAASAIAAASSAGAALWASGSYAAGAAARSPSNLRVYINRTTGLRTTDPALDPTNWVDAVFGERILITSATNLLAGKLYELDSRGGSFNVTLPAIFADGDCIGLLDLGQALAQHPVTVLRNGNNIRLLGEDLELDVSSDSLYLVGRTTYGWIEQ